MRVCPACKATYTGDEVKCAKCATVLPGLQEDDEAAISLSATLESGRAVALAASPTPSPVRARKPSESSPGGTTASSATAPGVAPATLEDRPDSLVGTHLAGRYEVTRKIGEGGMGAVYEARHSLIGKRVAIKVLLEKYAQKPDVVARLQQEARLASSIGHENIVDITDFGQTDDGRTFVVMEFLEGESLAQLLAREGPLAPARAIHLSRQVVSALGAAHGKGIVHRDVKPENVFIVRRAAKEFAKVVDFGISKLVRPQDETEGDGSPRLTQTGMVLGTPLYMSPEQARGEEELDQRIDVYAVGVILYEAVTGEVPYRGTNYLSIISQVLSHDPKRPSEVRPDLSVSPALEAVILKAMSKDRQARYADMAELDGDLARLEGGGEVAALSGHLRAAGRRSGRKGLLAGLTAVAMIVAAVALLLPRIVGEKPSAPPAAATATPATTPTAPGPEKPAASASPSEVHISVGSTPAGAEVWLDGKKLAEKTPFDIDLKWSNVKRSFEFRMTDYKPTTKVFYPNISQSVDVTLVPIAKKSRPTTKPPREQGGGEGRLGGGELDPDPFNKK